MGSILFAEKDGVHVLKFVGDVRLSLGPTLVAYLEKLESCRQFNGMIIDLSGTGTIDSTALGLIARIAICTRERFNTATSIISPREDITRILKSMAMEEVCVIRQDVPDEDADLSELPLVVCAEDTMRKQVLEAHRTLMNFNAENFEKFHDLVDALEKEEGDQAPAKKSACLG